MKAKAKPAPTVDWNKILAGALLAAAPVLFRGVLRPRMRPLTYAATMMIGMGLLNQLTKRVLISSVREVAKTGSSR